MEPKKWYLSKTLWFNILALIVAVASAFGYTGEVPEAWQAFVPAIVAGVNILLRIVTNQAVSR